MYTNKHLSTRTLMLGKAIHTWIIRKVYTDFFFKAKTFLCMNNVFIRYILPFCFTFFHCLVRLRKILFQQVILYIVSMPGNQHELFGQINIYFTLESRLFIRHICICYILYKRCLLNKSSK